MKTKELFDKAIQEGISKDPRGKELVTKLLEETKKDYEKLSAEKKKRFDKTKLVNPYVDSKIHHIAKDKAITKIMVGIDIDTSEIMLADKLGVDLVIAHHPCGSSLANLGDVMPMIEDIMSGFGVPINVAQGVLSERIAQVKRGVKPLNHNKTIDGARLMNMNFMNLHSPADNCVTTYLQKIFDKKNVFRVRDILDTLNKIEEYDIFAPIDNGPELFVGKEKNRAGKVYVDMTGGTGGSEKAMEKLAIAGVGTIITMHMSEKNREEAAKHNLNVVIAGHISSDSLGLNLLFDKILPKNIQIIEAGGFKRVNRK